MELADTMGTVDWADEVEAREKARDRILSSKKAVLKSQQILNEAEVVKQLALSSVDVDLSWDFKPEPISWLVEGLIPDAYGLGSGTLLCAYGPPGAGKTFVALDIAASVATGRVWAGTHNIVGERAGHPIIWVAMEGSAALASRYWAWCNANGVESGEEPLIFRVKSFEGLANPNAARALAYKMHYEFGLEDPAMIVVDTLQAAMVGMDENSVEDMSKAIGQLRWLCDYFSCPVLFIHHTAKKGQIERGSSYLRGSTDGMYFINGGKMSVSRFKEAPFDPDDSWSFKIESKEPSAYAAFSGDKSSLSERGVRVLDILRKAGKLSPKDLLSVYAIKYDDLADASSPSVTISKVLADLRERNLVRAEGATTHRVYFATETVK